MLFRSDETTAPLVAVRKSIDESFKESKIKEQVTDTGIQKILLKHLATNDGNPQLAFSPDGIYKMNQNITELNGGKFHQPIYKVRVYETLGKKFALGETGAKVAKYVEANSGTNLFFAIYITEEGKRVYESIPLTISIERKKQGLAPVPEVNGDGYKLFYTLSPNDLVYLPTEDEKAGEISLDSIMHSRIYKCVSFSTSQCFFIPYYVAYPIVPTLELGANNKAEKSWSEEMIKESCIPIKVDRLGNITLAKSN